MSILVTVTISATPEDVNRVEAENPELMAKIGGAAVKYFVSHRRLLQTDRVMDLDEFASKADYDAFIAEAAEGIKRYGELIGAPVTDTVWDVDDTPIPE